MFTTKSQLDKYVEKCLQNVNNERERHIKCFSFAKLYYKLGEYDEAHRCISTYLGAMPLSAEGLKVLAQILEKQGKFQAALDVYQKSLNIDPRQNNVILKGCELLASMKVNFDVTSARYLCERAQLFDPHNPVVSNLKERLIMAESQNSNYVTNMLLTTLKSRPDVVHTQIRLLQHMLQNDLIKEAYNQVVDVVQKNSSIFLINDLKWHETAVEALMRYQQDVVLSSNLNWEFWMYFILVLDKLVSLTLNVKTVSECLSTVFHFDQALKNAAQNIKGCNEKALMQAFLNHYTAQLSFHLAVLLFKNANMHGITYKECTSTSFPLLLIAYHTPPINLHSMWVEHSPEVWRQQVKRWHREAAFRCSQSGHIILNVDKERKALMNETVKKTNASTWRENLMKKLFVLQDQQSKLKTSHFVSSSHPVITFSLPKLEELIKYDEVAQTVYPESLHHLVWICLNQELATFHCTVFNGLPYSLRNLDNCSPNSLSVLDIDAFLYCTTFCVQKNQDEQRKRHQTYYDNHKPLIVPAAVTDELGTVNQTKWFTAAYKIFQNQCTSDKSELHLTLIRGIEVVRCIDNHGLDVELLVTLANTFARRAKNLDEHSEIEFNETRAELYWNAALPLLEKLQKNEAINYGTNRLFEHNSKMNSFDALRHIDDGKFFIATRLMKKKEYEEALRMFNELKSPYSSFYQAQIYKTMAEEQIEGRKENVTSEMRSRHVTLLFRAKDCLYLTLDRLRNPLTDRDHPLNARLGTEIRNIELLLNRFDMDMSVNQRSEYDGLLDESASPKLLSSTLMNISLNSTTEPVTPRSDRLRSMEPTVRSEARPSLESLDAQLRQMQPLRDATITCILDQFRAVSDSINHLGDELKTVKHTVNNELTNIKDSVVEELTSIKDSMNEIKKELRKVTPKNKPNQLSEEDLYVLEEEYGGDYGLNANVANFAAENLYPNYQGRLPVANSLTYPPPAWYPNLYPMYTYPGLGLPPQFGQEQQMPDFRALNSLPPPPAAQAIYGAQSALTQPGLPPQQQTKPWEGLGLIQQSTVPLPPTASNLFRDTMAAAVSTSMPSFSTAPVVPAVTAPATTRTPPVNVVITSSDPLPRTSIQTTQVLSVTIPPQHLKGNLPPKTQPHNYQIPLPAISILNATTTPSIINQPTPIISTQGLLSNVAPPVYSAVDKSPSKNTDLGLQIEKSLSQSLNDSSGNKSNISSASLDEHDPRPDFKPLIPLPDEVPVNTGEENETILFCERAKLFRFADKEWRERGVGNLKILQNKETGKVRLLMRRDQVHKICANHFLTKDTTLTPMPNNTRAYIWAANDFADEETVLEKLCVRFKTEEQADAFRKVFETATAALPAPTAALPTPETPKTSGATMASLGGFIFTSTPTFKPKEGSPVQSTTPVLPEISKSSSPFATFTFGGAKASTSVTATTSIFSTPISTPQKASVVPSPKTPSDEFEPTIDFKPVIPLPELVEVKTGEENAEVLFESRAKLLRYVPESKEWKERGVGIIKLLKENTIRLVMRREQLLKVCLNHQLLKNMQFTKMPSNPKAFSWYAQDFSEGVLKSEMFAIRFKSEEQADAFHAAITQAQDLLTDADVVKSDQKVTIPEIKSSVISTSEKIKSKEDKKLRSEPVSTKPDPPKLPSLAEKFKPKLGSWECKNCYIVNEPKVYNCVACETPKSNTTPKKSADAEKSGVQFSFGVSTTPSNPQFAFGATTSPSVSSSTGFQFGSNASWGDAFKPKQGSWECSQCLVRNDEDKLRCVSCENAKGDTGAPKTETGKGVDLKSSGLKFPFRIPTVTDTTPPVVCGWGDEFKPKKDTWECSQCLVRNNEDKFQCISCENPKDGMVAAFKKGTTPTKGVDLTTPGLQFNFGMPITITTSTAAAVASTPFNFTPQVSTTFTFGAIKPADTDSKPFSFAEENKDSFVFGSPQKHTFEFTPRSPRRHSSGCQGDEDDSYVEDENDHIYFKPVIPLPDKVEVKTGEEQEEVLYCHRAKLFRFVEGEWKERGIGDVKILLKPDTRKLRVVMRREQVLKICLNHMLTPSIEYIPKDEKTWLFTAPDYSEGEINHWQFCLRFKDPEMAKEFKAAIDDALKKSDCPGDIPAAKSSTSDPDVEFVSEMTVTPEEEQEALRLKLPPKFMAYRQLPDCSCDTCKKEDILLNELLKTSICKPSSFGVDNSSNKFIFGSPFKTTASPITPPVVTKSESLKDILTKPSVFANIATSNSALTPATQPSLFTNPPPASNLFGGQQKDGNSTFKTFSFALKTDATTPASSSAPIATFGSTFSGITAPTGSLFGTSTSLSSGTSIFGSAASPSGNIFGSAPSSTDSFKTSGNIFGATPLINKNTTADTNKPSIFNATGTPIFGASTDGALSFGSLAAKNVDESKKDDEVVLKCDSNLSFANLATAKPNVEAFAKTETSNKTEPFAFLGSGAPVFASSNKSTKKASLKKKEQKEKTDSGDEAEEGSETEATEEYDPHYEPIVPLPEAIVVSTGEEEETVMFNERAKLFRFDNETKEWKERGVGQIKILYHPVNGTYRFLLRREQVHKVVLNMLITSTLDIEPLTTSDKAWFWCGYNYSEDSSALEKLAVRFKNCDLAQQFRAAAQQAIGAVKRQQETKNLPSTIQNFGISNLRDEPIVEFVGEEEEEDEEDEDEEDDDDDYDDRIVMFLKHCTLSEQEENGQWIDVDDGNLQLYYDPAIYGARISITKDNGLLLSNTLVGMNTEMTVENNSCIWKAVEWNEDVPHWRTLKVTFPDDGVATEFYSNYLESVQFAHESDLVDAIPSKSLDHSI